MEAEPEGGQSLLELKGRRAEEQRTARESGGMAVSDPGGADFPREPDEAEWLMVHSGAQGR